jgi:hypothetical protein
VNAPVQVTLSPAEWHLVSSMRAVPESPLKARLDALFGELLKFANDPKCAESQADGVPCTSTAGDCESCRRVTDLIDLLRRRVSAA